MSVKPEQVQVGKCFVTAGGQVRRVTELKDGRVNYESRGKDPKGKWDPTPTLANLPMLSTFCKAVEREVECDFDAKKVSD